MGEFERAGRQLINDLAQSMYARSPGRQAARQARELQQIRDGAKRKQASLYANARQEVLQEQPGRWVVAWVGMFGGKLDELELPEPRARFSCCGWTGH